MKRIFRGKLLRKLPEASRLKGGKRWMILEITCYKCQSQPFARATPSGKTDSSPGGEKKRSMDWD